MAGLIDTELGGTKEKDVLGSGTMLQSTATGFDPEKRAVTSQETVSGQLDEILKTDSPLLQRARARAAEQSNARGLINSTMGAQAGEAAVIDAALPIAAADATAYGTAARDNQVVKNASLQFNAESANRSAAQNVTEANQFSLTKLRGEVDTGLQALRGNQATVLAEIESNYKQLMQANSSAASTFNEALAQISTILRDPNTSAEQKSSAVAAANNLLQSSLEVTGSVANLDLGALLNFSGTAPVPA